MSSQPDIGTPSALPPDLATVGFELLCHHCGHTLRNARLNGRCPQCAHPVGDTLHLGVINLATATVSADVPCLNCGYDLRSLGIHGVCPECGHAVATALVRSPLEIAELTWRERLSQGTVRLRIAGWTTPLLFVVYLAWMSALSPKDMFGAFIFTACCIGIAFLWASGILQASARNEALPQLNVSRRKHRLAQCSAIFASLLFIPATGLLAWAPSLANHGMWRIGVTLALDLAALLAIIAMGLLTLRLRHIALQTNHLRLAKHTSLWLGVVSIWAALALATALIATIMTLFQADLGRGIVASSLPCFVLTAVPPYITGIIGLSAYHRLIRPAPREYRLRCPP